MKEKDEGPEKSALLKIGAFAKLAGTNLRTLRYYEEIGLLAPASRSTGGFRFYRREDMNRLRMVGSLQGLGLELSFIRELMDTREEGLTREGFVARVRHALSAQSALLDERVRALEAQRRSLDQALAKLAQCQACNHRPETGNNYCHPCQVDGTDLPADLSALF